MSWDTMSFGRKITLGFGTVLTLLAVVVLHSFFGVGDIVENASEGIDGNKLDGSLAQKEVDHLNWANRVNALLTDDQVTALHVETDHHKCAFGKFLNGEERKQAEDLVPSLAPCSKRSKNPTNNCMHRPLKLNGNSSRRMWRWAIS